MATNLQLPPIFRSGINALNLDFAFNLYSDYPDYRMRALEHRIIITLCPSKYSLLAVSFIIVIGGVHILLALLLPCRALFEP